MITSDASLVAARAGCDSGPVTVIKRAVPIAVGAGLDDIVGWGAMHEADSGEGNAGGDEFLEGVRMLSVESGM